MPLRLSGRALVCALMVGLLSLAASSTAEAQIRLFAGATDAKCDIPFDKQEYLYGGMIGLGSKDFPVAFTIGGMAESCEEEDPVGFLGLDFHFPVSRAINVGFGVSLDADNFGFSQDGEYQLYVRPEVLFQYRLATSGESFACPGDPGEVCEKGSVTYLDVRAGRYKNRSMYVAAGISIFVRR